MKIESYALLNDFLILLTDKYGSGGYFPMATLLRQKMHTTEKFPSIVLRATQAHTRIKGDPHFPSVKTMTSSGNQ